MSLVVVATTEHAPFGDGGSDDRRRQPRGSGGADIGEEGVAERGGRLYLQPHESQLATFVEIPSAGPGGQCAHFICPITVRLALQQTFITHHACYIIIVFCDDVPTRCCGC